MVLRKIGFQGFQKFQFQFSKKSTGHRICHSGINQKGLQTVPPLLVLPKVSDSDLLPLTHFSSGHFAGDDCSPSRGLSSTEFGSLMGSGWRDQSRLTSFGSLSLVRRRIPRAGGAAGTLAMLAAATLIFLVPLS